jgi:hypothetical protein
MSLHRMLTPWTDDATWDSLSGGVSADGVEAAATPDFTVFPNTADSYAIFDVTATVQSWATSGSNFGWAILPAGTETWQFDSSATASFHDRPRLEITFARPLAADFDFDNDVDAADLAEWSQSFGPGSHADANRDAAADGHDFLLWQRQLGTTAATAVAAPVPEPGVLALALLPGIGLAARGSHRCPAHRRG